MDSLLTADSSALYLFFNDDVYLVDEPDVQLDKPVQAGVQVSPVQQATTFKFLGKNQRNILILVNDSENEVSNEAGRELLRKIVKSVGLSANDFALLNYANYTGTGFEQLMDFFSCTLIFAFGVTPLQLSLSTHPENTIITVGTVRIIFSAELRQLDQHPAGKKALWGSLQNLGL